MRTIDVSRHIPAPRSAVWAVLADFPNIADWNSGVKTSFATSDSAEGVGAKRHCDLAPMGGLEETIGEWVPDEKLVVNIDSATKIPMQRAVATFTLADEGDGTLARIDYDFEPKYGPLGKLIGPMLDKQMTKGMAGFLTDLDAAAQAGAASAAG